MVSKTILECCLTDRGLKAVVIDKEKMENNLTEKAFYGSNKPSACSNFIPSKIRRLR
jgi:hypothetical protein